MTTHRLHQPVKKIKVAKGNEKLPPHHYRIRITYAPLPSMAKLEKKFGKGNVSRIFDGRKFKPHRSCIKADLTPGVKVLWAAEVPADVLDDSEKIIVWADKQRNEFAPKGYRPATHQEIYEFQKKRWIDWLVALGSFAMVSDFHCVAALHCDSDRRIFGHDWFGDRWHAVDRFLFVRK